MQFELLPVVDAMIAIYEMPRDQNRFKAYLKLLTGQTDNDLDMPVGYFNPMAREHVTDKLLDLKKTGVEDIINETLAEINPAISNLKLGTFKVVLNLADDAKGGWTNRYTTDYDSKFKLSGLIKRHFCNPLFWVSERSNAQSIRQTTIQYCYRTIYQLQHPRPESLAAHIRQEKFVAKHAGTINTLTKKQLEDISAFYALYQNTKSHPVIFNFLYGDNAAQQLGYTPFGLKIDMAGYQFAAAES